MCNLYDTPADFLIINNWSQCRCWPISIQYLPVNRAVAFLYDVAFTEDVGLPTQCWINVGPALQAIAASMRSIVFDAGPTLILHWVCCILRTSTSANIWHSPNSVLMWSTVFDAGSTLKHHWVIVPCWLGLLLCYAGNAFLPCRQKGHFPDNTIDWPNADIMLCHRLRRWTNIIPTKTLWALITNIIVNIFFWTLFKHAST